MRYSKYIALGVGTPLVLVGSRLLSNELVLHFSWGFLLLAAVLFLLGQTLVRFEDLPRGKEIVDNLDTRFESKIEPKKETIQYLPSSVKPGVQSQKVIN